MESLFILIPMSIFLALLIGYLFWWSGKSGQFDDLDGPAHRILMDDDSTAPSVSSQDKDQQHEREKR